VHRQTNRKTGHLTSLFILGGSLLDFAIRKLRITSLEAMKAVERGERPTEVDDAEYN
jgi:hypothetical protein